MYVIEHSYEGRNVYGEYWGQWDWTKDLQKAQRFATRRAAEEFAAMCCPFHCWTVSEA